MRAGLPGHLQAVQGGSGSEASGFGEHELRNGEERWVLGRVGRLCLGRVMMDCGWTG